MFNFKTLAVSAAFAVTASFASADSWTLDADNSKIAFGSVKKDTVGEVHSFEDIAGRVGADGLVSVEINLASVQTWIDIRNERMLEHVFQNAPKAKISAKIDMEKLAGLSVGETDYVDVTGKLSLVGLETEIEAELFVARLSDTKVMVTTNEMIMVNTGDLGLDGGVDKLMELAKLPGITRVSPVSLRLVFDAGA